MQIVVLDTNICVSALVFAREGGIPTRALSKAVSVDILATCAQAEAELWRILTMKFRWEEHRAEAVFATMLARSRRVELAGNVRVSRDAKDDMFLECASRAGADLLVSGDKDLLVLGSYEGTRIITAAQYVGGGF